jgi:hypothetical protein
VGRNELSAEQEMPMRTLSLSLILVSLLAGCAHTSSDVPSGYPGFPSGPSAEGEHASGARHAVAHVAAREALDAPAAPEPRSFEPRLVLPREIAPREPLRRTDFVECWQCRR